MSLRTALCKLNRGRTIEALDQNEDGDYDDLPTMLDAMMQSTMTATWHDLATPLAEEELDEKGSQEEEARHRLATRPPNALFSVEVTLDCFEISTDAGTKRFIILLLSAWAPFSTLRRLFHQTAEYRPRSSSRKCSEDTMIIRLDWDGQQTSGTGRSTKPTRTERALALRKLEVQVSTLLSQLTW